MFKALENRTSFKPLNLVCNSSDYMGDNSSGLTSDILSSFSQLGSAAIMASSQGQNIQVNPYSRPVSQPYFPSTYRGTTGGAGTSTWLVLGLALVVGVFAFKKL